MKDKTIEQRTEFLLATKFGADDRRKIQEVMSWAIDNPEEAASYIVWLERHATSTGSEIGGAK